ncbi:tRNA dimethylallyltransferase [Armigeres subalbatus]|uniref:tRNA dimethylallyltransferase n=1 Tax=Armigeres subalbatus TaxID=124917 RepID=UPI002ED3D3EC
MLWLRGDFRAVLRSGFPLRSANFPVFSVAKMATTSADTRVKPLVVILGSTGTGKTKLSIELAQRFGGEIISADSMQVYRDLDIVTAKATKAEQSQAPHHLLDVTTPDHAFTVIHFRERALPIIDRLMSENRMPIIVGGTNYYIESVLWQVLVGSGIRQERLRRRRHHSEDDPKAIQSDEHQPDKVPKITNDDESPPSSSSVGKPEESKSCAESESESKSAAEKVRAAAEEQHKSENSAGEDTAVVGKHKASEITADEAEQVLLMTTQQMEQLESRALHGALRRVDPVTANRLHPNNKRKIVRALEVFQQEGRALSSILSDQRALSDGCKLGGPLRYRNVVLLWLRCEQETLNARLDARVDSMVAQGLLAEIRQFYERYVKPYEDNDFHQGILQSIGFKEFVRYLEKYDHGHDQLITDYMRQLGGDRAVPEGVPLLQMCLDNLKQVTQRYSKRQIKWINHRFLGDSRREVPPIYALDTTDVAKWTENVFTQAEQVVQSVLAGEIPSKQPLPRLTTAREGLNEETSFFCDVCQRTIVGEYQWQLHMRSNKHKKCVQSKSKQAKLSTVD